MKKPAFKENSLYAQVKKMKWSHSSVMSSCFAILSEHKALIQEEIFLMDQSVFFLCIVKNGCKK